MPNTYHEELYYEDGGLAYAGMGYDRYGEFIRHGRGKAYDEDGNLFYEGDFVNDKQRGRGKSYSEDGTLVYEGDFVDGKWHGRGKLYDEDGTLVYEGDFVNNKRHGRGKLYREDGRTLRYEGDYVDGRWQGQGKLYCEDGTLAYEGDFVDGKRHGRGKLYRKDGTLFYEGDYRQGTATGKGKEYQDDGRTLLYEGDFVDGEWSGYGTLYHEDGTLEYEGEFKDSEPVNAVTTKTPQNTLEACLEELNSLTGLMEVKAQVHSLVNLIRLQNERRERGLPVMPMSFHLAFTGNPGTGKTTVARLLAQIYAHLGIVSKGHLVETDRTGLVAGYLGQTALKTDGIVNQARGGVLFIDEAYSLTQDHDSYGQEAIDCIMKRMEDYRDDLVIIAAGYKEPMERFLDANPGLKSRFNRHIHFENYTSAELMEILDGMCVKNGYTFQPECREQFCRRLEEKMASQAFMENFSNGRYIRNLFEKLVFAQGNRLAQTDIGTADVRTLTEISIQDLQYITNNQEFEKTY